MYDRGRTVLWEERAGVRGTGFWLGTYFSGHRLSNRVVINIICDTHG